MIHLLKIKEIFHFSDSGKIMWSKKSLKNILHQQGQEYMIKAIFSTSSASIPSNYYLGLDARNTPDLSDTLTSSLSGEPTQNGYSRQPVASLNGFTVELDGDNYTGTSGTITFSASGGAWGPVKNIFLATTLNNSGYLISTVALSSTRTLLDGQSLSMRFVLGLANE